jgi:spoIIIJ-associated protein
MAKHNSEELAKKQLMEILDQIGISAKVSSFEKDGVVDLKVEGENLGALIGFHGETLASLQLIIALSVNKQLKESDWTRVNLDIGSWKQERINSLKDLVDRSIEQIEQDQKDRVTLPSMSPAERREVHVIVSENHPEFESISEGEEPDRKIILKIKQPS